MTMGRIICTGLGPGDPDLMSVKSDRIIRSARHVAYFRKAGRAGQARRIAFRHSSQHATPARAASVASERKSS